jgi:large subunit ribosomal protein L4
MAAPKAPLLDAAGKATKDLTLQEEIFGAELKAHLVHEAVRAELNARRSGTRGAKTRGLVAGGRAKPWRQKGTGRARAGTIRAPQFTGGGVVFAPGMRDFDVKVNKKAKRSAFRSALSDHVTNGTLGILSDSAFDTPSTKAAAAMLASWRDTTPIVLVVTEEQDGIVKSFRNLYRVLVVTPDELEVSEVVWARTLLVTEAALPLVEKRAA